MRNKFNFYILNIFFLIFTVKMDLNKSGDEDFNINLFLKSITLNNKNISFNEKVNYIYTPVHLIEELNRNRQNSSLQKKADHIRMENLLNPILISSHRQKIWIRNFNLQDPVNMRIDKNPDIYKN